MIKYHSVMTDTWSIVCRRKYIIIYKTSSKYYIIRIMNASVVFDEWNARFCIVSSWLCNTLVKSTHFRHVASGWERVSPYFSCIYIFKKVNYWGVPPSKLLRSSPFPQLFGDHLKYWSKNKKMNRKIEVICILRPPPLPGGGGRIFVIWGNWHFVVFDNGFASYLSL